MDAIQLATACIMGCDLFLTNDKQLKQFKEIKCIVVDELEQLQLSKGMCDYGSTPIDSGKKIA